MKGVAELYEAVQECGLCRVEKFQVSREEAQMHNLQCMLNGQSEMEICPGTYVRMYVDGEGLVMSDTPMERHTNAEFIRQAHGDVMIVGCGVGLILHNLREKTADGTVTHIVVYEKYPDVLEVVAPLFRDMPVEFRVQDIMEYRPPLSERYDTIYFDIWPDINVNNLRDIRLLHNRWKNHKKNGGWMNSWMKEYLQRRKREEYRKYGEWW